MAHELSTATVEGNPNIRVNRSLLARGQQLQLRPVRTPTTLFEQLGAAFNLENTVASVLNRI